MPDVTLYKSEDGALHTDGSVEASVATDADIIKARSKIYKDDFMTSYVQDGNHLLLDAIRTSTQAEGKFTGAAVDDGNEGEFAITCDHPNATDARAKEMLKLMVLIGKLSGGRIVGAQKKNVYITTYAAEKWADMVEEALAYNT